MFWNILCRFFYYHLFSVFNIYWYFSVFFTNFKKLFFILDICVGTVGGRQHGPAPATIWKPIVVPVAPVAPNNPVNTKVWPSSPILHLKKNFLSQCLRRVVLRKVHSDQVAMGRVVQYGFAQSEVVQGRVVKDRVSQGVSFEGQIIMGQIVQKRIVQNRGVNGLMVQSRSV